MSAGTPVGPSLSRLRGKLTGSGQKDVALRNERFAPTDWVPRSRGCLSAGLGDQQILCGNARDFHSERDRTNPRRTTPGYPAVMPNRVAAASVLALAVLTGCANPGPSAAPSYAKPPLHDEFLDHLVGEWRIERSARGRTLENTMTARWVLQHQFVEVHMIDPASPPQYEATVHIGFDPAKSRYVAHWCDNFGAGLSSVGSGTRNGDSVEFRFEYDDGPFFNTFTWHPDDHSWTFEGENGQPDGSRKLFMKDRATQK